MKTEVPAEASGGAGAPPLVFASPPVSAISPPPCAEWSWMRCGLATAVAFGVPEHPLSGPRTGDRSGPVLGGRRSMCVGPKHAQARVDRALPTLRLAIGRNC